jgi:hypothetical protein
VDRVLRLLYRGPRAAPPAVANPYRDEAAGLDRPGAAWRRRRNLESYLAAVGPPRLLLIGEAIGYRGGRFSGIAFTSERQLGGDRPLPWAAAAACLPTSRRPGLWTEPSATAVWRALGGEARGVLLWNAFPWHPWGFRGRLSNRRPEERWLGPNLHVLEALLAAVPAARVAAVGRTAERCLARLGVVPAAVLRHPAHGGAGVFAGQVAGVLQSDNLPRRSP